MNNYQTPGSAVVPSWSLPGCVGVPRRREARCDEGRGEGLRAR